MPPKIHSDTDGALLLEAIIANREIRDEIDKFKDLKVITQERVQGMVIRILSAAARQTDALRQMENIRRINNPRSIARRKRDSQGD